jgi:hypothetical protein
LHLQEHQITVGVGQLTYTQEMSNNGSKITDPNMVGVGVKLNLNLGISHFVVHDLIDGEVVTLYVTLNLNQIKQRLMKKKRNLQ